ncbi:unnamed protein product [Closterium sp. NIES-64]|nr:unnamed protein product [Closterium sp. NIES-64]
MEMGHEETCVGEDDEETCRGKEVVCAPEQAMTGGASLSGWAVVAVTVGIHMPPQHSSPCAAALPQMAQAAAALCVVLLAPQAAELVMQLRLESHAVKAAMGAKVPARKLSCRKSACRVEDTVGSDPVNALACTSLPEIGNLKHTLHCTFMHGLPRMHKSSSPPLSAPYVAAAALVAMASGLWTQPTCTIAGQASIPGTLPLVFYNPAGMVLDIVLSGVKANGFFPTDSSKLSALTKLQLHQNYFSGSFPACISALSALTELWLNLNYLTGSMPAALPATLKVIDLSSNYLVGTFLTTTATFCSCATNCLQDASKCPSGTAQRASWGCAVCEMPDATGRMCGGGICTPNATMLIAASMVNTGTAAMYCLGTSMDPVMGEWSAGVRAALLNMKASLGVTFTEWALDVPCTIQGLPPLAGTWSNVVCNVSGKVILLNLRSNFLEGQLDVFAVNFKALTLLKEVYLDFNWFTGPISSTLVGIATLSTLTPNSATAVVLPRFCVGVPLDATQGNIPLALKSTLGVTFSDWTTTTLAAPKATSTKPKAGGAREGVGAAVRLEGRGVVHPRGPDAHHWILDWRALLTARPNPCSLSAASPADLNDVVCRDLRSQLLSGTVHSDISKLSTLTSLRLTSNLFFNRLDSYILPITPAATLKELHINFNWFYGTIPTTLVNMPALSFL